MRNTYFKFSEITEENVYRTITSTKTSKCAGQDKIAPKLIKLGVKIINKSLTEFFNKPLSSGIFPDDFKIALLSPIYKTGNKSGCSIF